MVCDGIAGGSGFVPPKNPDNKKNFPNFLKNWNGIVLSGGTVEGGFRRDDKGTKEVFLFPVGEGKDERIKYTGIRDVETGRTEYHDGTPRGSIWVDIEGDGIIDKEIKWPYDD